MITRDLTRTWIADKLNRILSKTLNDHSFLRILKPKTAPEFGLQRGRYSTNISIFL